VSNQEFSKIILAKMHGVLKPSGFRKRGSTFVRECDDGVVLAVRPQLPQPLLASTVPGLYQGCIMGSVLNLGGKESNRS